MNCQGILLMLPEFTTGRLSEEEAASVAAHIEQCTACRDAYSDIKNTLEAAAPNYSAIQEPPREFWESIWPGLYVKIRENKLHIRPEHIIARLRRLFPSFRPGILQVANAAIIIAAGTWFIVSYHSDIKNPRGNMIQSMIEQAAPEMKEETAEKLIQKRDAFIGAIFRAAVNPQQPLETLQEYLDPDKQEKLYDSMTDYFAEMVIRFSEKS